MTGQQGFTLVEILITLAVVGILAAVGFNSLLPFLNRTRVENAAAESGALVRYAISEARRNNTTLTLSVSSNVLTVKRGTTTVRTTTLPLTPTLTCRTTCPTTLTFTAPFGRSDLDFKLAFQQGTVSRVLWVRGPTAMVTLQ